MNITEKIQKLRAEKGWSVAELSRVTEIPTVSLRVMLSRDDPNNYNVKALILIAEALDTTVSYLTKEDKDNVVPEITKIQRKELQKVISEAVDHYFSGEVQKKGKN
jgi:transcriptional regulator with XRE-family HTH domain